jgi:glycosyltransferase involved in cell wall biosynthesis
MTVMASVVIPARNAASTIDDQLAALVGQDHTGPWEVIVADNASTDDTARKAEQWSGQLPLRVVDATGRHGYSYPRNVGVAAARGDVIMFCDADDIVVPGWLRSMVEGLEHADIVAGPLDRITLNQPKQYAWMAAEDLHQVALPEAYGHLPFVPGGNMGIRRAVFDALGGFDVRLRGGEDIDLSWRALRLGYKLGFARGAVIHYRLRDKAVRVALRRFDGGRHEPGLYRWHRHDGMGRDPARTIVRLYASLALELPFALRSSTTRWSWAHRAGGRAGRLVGSIRHRTLFL